VSARSRSAVRKVEGVREWVLRRVFGPKMDEVTRKWRKLHNKELNDLYFTVR
jgi:hypothetical protein